MEWLNKKYIYLLFLLPFVFSCTKEMSPQSFAQWVEDPENGLKIEKKVGGLNYTLQYKPTAYIVAMEEQSNGLSEEKLIQKTKQLGTDLEYFNFQIAPENRIDLIDQVADSKETYDELFHYFNGGLRKDIYLLDGQDTSRCELFQFIPNQKMTPNLDFVLAFEKSKGNDRIFVFDDNVFHSGTIRMIVEESAIEQQPKIRTK